MASKKKEPSADAPAEVAEVVLSTDPAPITPDSSAQAARNRVGFEAQVNAQVEAFLANARLPVTEAFLAGAQVELQVTLPE